MWEKESVCLRERERERERVREREKENVLGAHRNAKIYCGRKPTSLKMEKELSFQKINLYLVIHIVCINLKRPV